MNLITKHELLWPPNTTMTLGAHGGWCTVGAQIRGVLVSMDVYTLGSTRAAWGPIVARSLGDPCASCHLLQSSVRDPPTMMKATAALFLLLALGAHGSNLSTTAFYTSTDPTCQSLVILGTYPSGQSDLTKQSCSLHTLTNLPSTASTTYFTTTVASCLMSGDAPVVEEYASSPCTGTPLRTLSSTTCVQYPGNTSLYYKVFCRFNADASPSPSPSPTSPSPSPSPSPSASPTGAATLTAPSAPGLAMIFLLGVWQALTVF